MNTYKKYPVIIWGNSTMYDLYFNQLEFEAYKGNIDILGIITTDMDHFQHLNSYNKLSVDDLPCLDYTYIIALDGNDIFQNILRLLTILRIDTGKVIHGKVFLMPGFDFHRYISIKSKNISILSNTCWGGITYHALGLPFLSPFINMWSYSNDYLKLLTDFEAYMKVPLTFEKELFEKPLNRNYPLCRLNDIQLHFNHYTDFDSARSFWDRRKERLNYHHLFIEMRISTYEQAEQFSALPYEHKMVLAPLIFPGLIKFFVLPPAAPLRAGSHCIFHNRFSLSLSPPDIHKLPRRYNKRHKN